MADGDHVAMPESPGEVATDNAIMTLDLPQLLSSAASLKQHMDVEKPHDKVWLKRFERFRAVFYNFREVYGAESKLLDCASLVKRLPFDEGSNQLDISASMLGLANIVSFMSDLRQKRNDTEQLLAVIADLDTSFTACFLPSEARINYDWLNDKENDPVRHAISIRTVRYLLELWTVSPVDFDPVALLAETFCDTSGDADHESLLTHGPYLRLGEFDPNADHRLRTQYAERVALLRSLVTEDLDDAITRVEERFTVDYLVDDLLPWCNQLFAIMQQHIDAQLDHVDGTPDTQELAQPPAESESQATQAYQPAPISK